MAGQSGKEARYEALRSEGRDLCGQITAVVADLERNARFSSRLPPIAQLITAESEEDVAIWRERLSTIFEGLLEANPTYRAIVYKRIRDDTFQELVRVERQSQNGPQIRIVPRSRLAEAPLNDFVTAIMRQKPGDVISAVVPGTECNPEDESDYVPDGLIGGVPVFDVATEDPFGLTLIDCNIDAVLRGQLSKLSKCTEVAVVSGDRILIRKHNGQIDEDSIGASAETLGVFQNAISWLESHTEFIDATDANIYGTRIRLGSSRNTVMVLLRQE